MSDLISFIDAAELAALEREGSLELRANVISLSRHGNRTVCNSLPCRLRIISIEFKNRTANF
jgi:hypothetical protein